MTQKGPTAAGDAGAVATKRLPVVREEGGAAGGPDHLLGQRNGSPENPHGAPLARAEQHASAISR